MFDEKKIEALNAKLDPKHVVKPKGSFGPKGDYLEGWHVIDEANRVFGFDGWSYSIVEMKQCHEPYQNQKNNWMVGYTARIRVEVSCVEREDVGYGSGAAGGIGDAHESAVKEAVTDGLKRALRTFGNRFGLALYDKKKAGVGAPEPKGDAKEGNPFDDDTSDKMKYVGYAFDMIDRKKSPEDLDAWWKAEAGARRKNGLTQSDVDELAEAFKLRKQTLLNSVTDKAGNEQHPLEAG